MFPIAGVVILGGGGDVGVAETVTAGVGVTEEAVITEEAATTEAAEAAWVNIVAKVVGAFDFMVVGWACERTVAVEIVVKFWPF